MGMLPAGISKFNGQAGDSGLPAYTNIGRPYGTNGARQSSPPRLNSPCLFRVCVCVCVCYRRVCDRRGA